MRLLLLLLVVSAGIQVQAQDTTLETHAKAALQSLQRKDFAAWKNLFPGKDVMMEIIGRIGNDFGWEDEDASLKPLLEESYYLKAQSKLLRQFVAYFRSNATTEGDTEKGAPVNWGAMQYQRIQVSKIPDQGTDTIMEKYKGWILLKDDFRQKEWVLRFDDVIKYKDRFYGMDIDVPFPLQQETFDEYVKKAKEPARQPEYAVAADSLIVAYADTAAAVAMPEKASPVGPAHYAGTFGGQNITFYWEVYIDEAGRNYRCSYSLPKQKGSIHFEQVQELGNENYLLIDNGGTFHLHRTAKAITGIWISPDGSKQHKINLKRTAG